MAKSGEFRNWLRNRWLDHADEIIAWTGKAPTYAAADYYRRYKWWLVAEFKRQRKKGM